MYCSLRNEFSSVSYYGKGPFENYADRSTAAVTAIHQASVQDMFTPYIVPQENGLRTGTHWCSVRNDQGCGIVISALDTDVSAGSSAEVLLCPYPCCV